MILRLAELLVLLLILAVAAIVVVGYRADSNTTPYDVATGGIASRGKRIIVDKNCGSCHTIPGIRGADGVVGPPLFFFGRRTFIAGELPNTPENLVLWITSPQSVEPKTAMPNLGLTDAEARDVAAYLYTLR